MLMRKRVILLGLSVAVLLVTTAALADEGRPTYREGEVIVKYKEGAARAMADMDAVYHRAGAVDVKRFHGPLRDFEHMTIDTSAQSVESVVADLERDPGVEYAQPNYLIYADDLLRPERDEAERVSLAAVGSRPGVMPRPPEGPAAADPGLGLTWGLAKIGAPGAWGRVRGSRAVVVAVIDTGIDYNHPDLAANIWRNPRYGRVQETGFDAEAQLGISGDLVGWDFVHNDRLPYDDAGHGTHVSGTIGAVGNNGKGMSGVSQRVSLMAVKFMGANGVGDTAAAIRGIDYALSRGAKVLNNSWGGRGGANPALRDAIHRSAAAGALFVAAAGNDGTDDDTYFVFPASFAAPNMLTVAATTPGDGLASFSNTGARTVHMGAPGVGVYSTKPGGAYGYMSGTSMAAPYVAGAAALVWAARPSWSAAQVKQRLLQSGDPLSSLAGKTVSGRRLNVKRALQ